MIFFLFHIEIEGKGGWIIWGGRGGKGMLPPLKLFGGGPGPPLPTPMHDIESMLSECLY